MLDGGVNDGAKGAGKAICGLGLLEPLVPNPCPPGSFNCVSFAFDATLLQETAIDESGDDDDCDGSWGPYA